MAPMPPPTSAPPAAREAGCWERDEMAKPAVATIMAVASERAVPNTSYPVRNWGA